MTPILDGSDGDYLPDRDYDTPDPEEVDPAPRNESLEVVEIEPVTYPTEWHLFDVNRVEECRQLDEERYEIRSETKILTVNQEGFDLYRDDSPQGQVIFVDWTLRNQVTSYPREAVESSEYHPVEPEVKTDGNES